jgi:hypothetical protein
MVFTKNYVALSRKKCNLMKKNYVINGTNVEATADLSAC